jgi:Tropinone reductase 1
MAQVNNAAQAIIKPTMECTAEDYSRLMATNLESCFHLSQLAHPLLRNSSIAGGGSIVHISSIASVMAFQEVTIYSIAKGTMLSLVCLSFLFFGCL